MKHLRIMAKTLRHGDGWIWRMTRCGKIVGESDRDRPYTAQWICQRALDSLVQAVIDGHLKIERTES